jgi:hypothetical protein
VGRPEHELAGLLVVEVDEACVGVERVGHFARDEGQDFLQVERRVHRRAGLGQEAQVTSRYVHESILGRSEGAAGKSLPQMLNKTLTQVEIFRHTPWVVSGQ